ncbi:hypothetical protein KKA87_02525 [bacterium]|nr:hypothetical protein [bacterium]MBU1872822.1 hypothetical protein [bacterium]
MEDDQLINFFTVQHHQKLKQMEDSTKLYFQAIIVLGAGVIGAITALSNKDSVANIFYIGIPLFLISWFGCFLWIYFEHHMSRISFDYTEMKLSESLGLSTNETYLYHEDYLGVFNQANFLHLRKKLRFVGFKSIHLVFLIIGVPGFILFLYCGIKAFKIIQCKNLFWSYFYGIGVIIMFIVLLSINVQCVFRERKFKKHLGINTKWGKEI